MRKIFFYIGTNAKTGRRSSKYWAVEQLEKSVIVQWGKLDGNSIISMQRKAMEYADSATASQAANIKERQKVLKGYIRAKADIISRASRVALSKKPDYESVSSVDQIRQQIEWLSAFLQDPCHQDLITANMLRSSRYWVYDSKTRQFGLGKMVGYHPVQPTNYIMGLAGSGPWMTGGGAQAKIQSVTGKQFVQSDKLLRQFKVWARTLLPDIAGDHLQFDKIKFISI